MLGLAHVVAPRRARRPRLHRRAHRGLRRRSRSCSTPTRPTAVEEITGIPAADLEAAAHIYGEAANASILWGLGVTEHKYGSEVVQLICNLAMMTGKIGRPGSALLPLRGQNNVQGSSDMGALPDTYTAYRRSTTRTVAQQLRGGVGRPALAREGLQDPGDVRRRGRRGASRRCTSSARTSRRPTRTPTHVVKALESLEFLVCQDIFENETTKFADVILPGLGVPREVRDVHQRRAPLPARRAGDRPARRRRRPTSRSSRTSRARSATRWAGETPADAMDEIARADARLRRRQPRADRPHAGCSGRSPPTAPTRRSSTRRSSSCPAAGPLRRAALQGAGRRGRRRVPADPRHRPAARSTTTPAR